MAAMYQIKKRPDGKFFWTLQGENGETLLTFHCYLTKEEAINGINLARTFSAKDERYRRLIAKGDKHYFLLTTPENQTLGKSELYDSGLDRDKGIEATRKVGPGAGVSE